VAVVDSGGKQGEHFHVL